MKSTFTRLALGAALALSLPLAAQAQTGSASPNAPAAATPKAADAKLDSADRDFLENAAQSGHLEIEGSKLALEKAHSQDVKTFAQKMIDDHGKVGQQLATLAKSKGYEPPTGPSMMQQARLKTLGMRDDGFDKAYAEEIGVSAHEDAVKLFEKASKEAKDADVKKFAADTLPALKQHLDMAKTLHQAVDKK
ncbi:DUF305 domain-containing protein [Bordetella genomosp. 1]|uniref:DUF305 domain-containing protein n=1 Tax=Bordetella genomosp. 1 TaxID=1395607 RepID=A0A261SH83_9BORD|nr:DUF4142 domain-containing protein [Bordetella genomosp. 1]OZI36140.1 DUF305 domain-containing protein [Bordetella genomosp. 1]